MDCSSPGCSIPGISPGQNTGVGSHSLLQGIFPTQGSNLNLLHCRRILYCPSYQGSPNMSNNILRVEQITPWWLSGREPACMQETWVPSLGWEDSLEKGNAAHSSILAWRNPRTEQSMGSQSQTWLSNFHFRAEQIFQVRGLSNIDWVEKLSWSRALQWTW